MALPLIRTLRLDHGAARRHLWLLPVFVWGVVCWTTYVAEMSPQGHLDRSGHLKGHDFLHFYVLGEIGRARATTELYDFDAQARRTDRLVPEYPHRFLPVHAPQVAMFFAPLAGLPYLGALTVWLLASVVAYAASVAAMTRSLPALVRYRSTVAIAAAAAPAAYSLVASGQTSAFTLAWFTAAYFAARSRRSFLMGLCLGSLAYKPTFGVVLPAIWIAARDWRALAGAALAAAIQVAAAAAYFGPHVLVDYAINFRVVSRDLPLLEAQPWLMHTFSAFVALLGMPTTIARAITAFGAIVVAVATARIWTSTAPLSLRFSAVLLATVLLSPHLYAYDLVVLTPALLLTVAWALDRPSPDTPLLVAGYATYLLPAFDGLTRATHVQWSIVAMAAWLVMIWRRRHRDSVAHAGTAPAGRDDDASRAVRVGLHSVAHRGPLASAAAVVHPVRPLNQADMSDEPGSSEPGGSAAAGRRAAQSQSHEGAVMKSLLQRFVREEEGQDLIEYAFLAVFIALAVIVGIQAVASGLNTQFSNIGTQVSSS
ncbi:MAG: DUF2029 domain-containing protein [Acidobacteria bacterium]|nr:DUF2029 domain-containing protein [Acidobacteriota bacterium]